MSKIKVIALFGKSGAGKDTIQKWMVSSLANTKGIISYTTRPQRDYEKHGIDYYFITKAEFAKKINNFEFIETTKFNDWMYGTTIDSFDPDALNVGVFNIEGIINLVNNSDFDVLPVFIEAPDLTRLKRNLKREKSPDCREICRRFLADETDFEDIPFEYALYYNLDSNEDFYNICNIPSIRKFIEAKFN